MSSQNRSKDDLDEQIIAIQRSTRTSLPIFTPVHNFLRMRFAWYYRWHLSPVHSLAQWGFLLLYLIGIIMIIRSVFWFFGF